MQSVLLTQEIDFVWSVMTNNLWLHSYLRWQCDETVHRKMAVLGMIGDHGENLSKF